MTHILSVIPAQAVIHLHPSHVKREDLDGGES